ncbi:MAG: DUF748 domain-containing protein, partial [Bacteroidota bacterium]
PLRIVAFVGLGVGALVLVCGLALLLFSDPLANTFMKPRITEAFAEAFPEHTIRIAEMRYSVLMNRFGFDSVELSAVDGTTSGSIASISAKGIGWMHILWGGTLVPDDFANTVVDAQAVVLKFPQSHYELRSEQLQVSVPDSELVVESFKYHPLGDDQSFFAASKFRQTRYRLVVPHAKATGLACLELLQETAYRARSLQIRDASFDVVVNKNKPSSTDDPSPPMPHELLSSIQETLRVDRVNISNGRAEYSEIFAPELEPPRITFDSLQVLAEGIANHGDRGVPLVLRAQAILAKAGTIDVLISIPVASPEFSFEYSGSLSGMDLRALNSFLEPAEQMRIKTGTLERANFDVHVVSGRAFGSLRGIYRDLSLAAINKQTGSEKGLSDKITSFIANEFKIHGTNVPDKPDSFKIGKVNYMRKPDDTFIQYVWYALRTAVQDVVGF